MKSKFSKVVSIRKQNLDKIEQNLAKARMNVDVCQQNLALAKQTLIDLKIPKNGSSAMLRQNLELMSVARNEVAFASEKLELAKKEVMHFSFLYKKANIEYEKMKFLEQNEIDEFIKKKKRDEALMLDEIATMRFAMRKDN